MSGSQASFFYGAIMLLTGLGIPIMGALNSTLGAKIHNPLLAVPIFFTVSALAAAIMVFVIQGRPQWVAPTSLPFYYYLGGIFVVFYVAGVTWIAPRFGIGNAVAFALLGQLMSMAVIDHFSLFGAPHHPITLQRFGGLVIMAVGIFLAVRRG